MLESNRIMFEIYRETYSRSYRVVYFTELNDHNRDIEISKALAGDHFYSGYIREYRKDDAKKIIDGLLDRLNEGEDLSTEALEKALEEHIPAGAGS